MATIELVDIAHSYQSNPKTDSDWALKSLSHCWKDGGAYALLGPSGCGKSTLLNIISGLIHPTCGSLHFNNEDVTILPPEKRNIAQVFQFPVVYDTMSVHDNLAFPLKNRGISQEHINARVSNVAALLELDALLNLSAAELSADAKQIVSLGRGLVRDDIGAILFDEPLTVVNPQIKWQLRSALKRLHRQTGFTMIYVTHDQTEALTFADEIAVMHDGKIVQCGSPIELFECPRHTFVGHFIGSPGMNILPCQVEKNRGDSVIVASHQIPISPYAGVGQGKIELGIRPEFVRFTTNGEGLPATVHKAQDLGMHRLVYLNVAGSEIKMLIPHDVDIPSSPFICFEPKRAYLYEDGQLREDVS